MSEIVRNRVIRPSTRAESSDSYKIDTKVVGATNKLLVNVSHENRSINLTYKFEGRNIADRNSIHFKVNETEESITISWVGITPIEISSSSNENIRAKLVHRLPSRS